LLDFLCELYYDAGIHKHQLYEATLNVLMYTPSLSEIYLDFNF